MIIRCANLYPPPALRQGLTRGPGRGHTLSTMRPIRILAAALMFLPAGPLGATAERPLKATLTEHHGEVRVSGAEGAEDPAAWEPAEAGMTLLAGSKVKTDKEGTADLLFEDGTAVHIDKGADFELTEAREEDRGRIWKIRLWAGRLLSQVVKGPRPARYQVRTPVAVAAVRGTEFVADVSESGGTGVAVFEGEVESQAFDEEKAVGEPVTVQPDQEVALEPGRAAGPPRAISQGMKNFRNGSAALFRARIAAFRQDTQRVIRLRQKFMERRRKRIKSSMENNRKSNADAMRDFRKNLRRRPNRP